MLRDFNPAASIPRDPHGSDLKPAASMPRDLLSSGLHRTSWSFRRSDEMPELDGETGKARDSSVVVYPRNLSTLAGRYYCLLFVLNIQIDIYSCSTCLGYSKAPFCTLCFSLALTLLKRPGLPVRETRYPLPTSKLPPLTLTMG